MSLLAKHHIVASQNLTAAAAGEAASAGPRLLTMTAVPGQADRERAQTSSQAWSGFRTIIASLVVFLVVFIAVRHARPTGILLYQGIVVGVFVSLVQFQYERQRSVKAVAAAKDSLLVFLLAYAFVFTVPTTVDRAYSVRMINTLDASPNGLTRDQITTDFSNGFLEKGGVDKRLKEQAATGSIRERDGRYSLTPVGHFLSVSFRAAQAVFSCGAKR